MRRISTLASLTTVLAVTLFQPVQAQSLLLGDAAKGKKLHDSQCTACHDTRVYTRKDRRIRTVEGLLAQVQTCNKQLKKGLGNDEINDLVKYLNDTYYKF